MHDISDELLYKFTLPSGYEDDVLVRVHPINGNYVIKVLRNRRESLLR